MEAAQIENRRWMDLATAANYTNLPVKALRRAISNGDLPFSRPGRKQIVDKKDLDTWLTGLKIRLN